jgi:hypothetical protein
MTSVTATAHRATATTVLTSRRASAAIAAGTFLVIAPLYTMQSGHSTPATNGQAQELVHQDLVPHQPTQFIFRPGEPY